MPLYEYECISCRGRFEVIQKFSDPPVTECRLCGGRVKKLLGTPMLQFKGSGFYITDYAGKKPRAGNGEDKVGPAPGKKKPGGAPAGPAKAQGGGDTCKQACACDTPKGR